MTNTHKSKDRYIWGRIKQSRSGELNRADMTVESYGKMLYRDHEIESPEVGANVIKSFGPELLKLMSEAKNKDFDWTKRRIFKQLSELGEPDLHLQSYRSIVLRPRQRKPVIYTQKFQELEPLEDGNEIVEQEREDKLEGKESSHLRDEKVNAKEHDKTVKPKQSVVKESVEPVGSLPAENNREVSSLEIHMSRMILTVDTNKVY